MLMRLFPVIFSMVFLTAHFIRVDDSGLTALVVLLTSLLFLKRRWVTWVVRIFLLVGCAVWVDTILRLIRMRQVVGESWGRMAVILGIVTLYTAVSILVFRAKKVKAFYEHKGRTDVVMFSAFLITGGLLSLIQGRVDVPMLLAERFFPGWGWVEIFLLSAYAAFVSEKMMDPARSARWRFRIWVLFSLVFFAQLLVGLSGVEKCLMTGKLHLPIPAMIVAGPLYRGGRAFMLFLFAATILIVGPAWCSHLCYVGAWDAASARRKKNPRKLPEGRPRIRLAVFLLVPAVALGMRILHLPGSLATMTGGLFGLLGVGIMVFWSRRAGAMTHCLAYCPIGLMANLMGKISPFRIRIKKECHRCRLCSKVCRYDALTDEDLKRRKPGGTCSLCGDCLATCSEGLIHYGFLKMNPSQARMLFLILAVSLHAVFLGVARI